MRGRGCHCWGRPRVFMAAAYVLLLVCLEYRGGPDWPPTALPPPELPGGTRRYAAATGISSRDYEATALTFCWSWRRAVPAWPSDVDLVVVVTDRGNPPPNATLLARCFTRVLLRPAFGGPLKGNSAGSRDVLLALELDEYARVLWMEADFIVARGQDVLGLLRTPVKFAAVQGLRPQYIWQGALALVEPDPSLSPEALRLLGTWLCFGCIVDSDHVLVWLFPPGTNGTAVLPAEYNAEPLYGDSPALRGAKAVHFSGRKPWQAACRGLGAYGVWAELLEEAAQKYGRPFPPPWAREDEPTLAVAACGPRPDAFA